MSFPTCRIGPYRLQASLSGFRTFQRTGIVLQVNANPDDRHRDGHRRTRRDRFSRGGDAAGRDAQSRRRSGHRERANRGTAAQWSQRHGLDCAGRRRGAAAGAERHEPQHARAGQAFAVAGGQAFGVAYLLDGATHNNPYDNLNLPLPFPDALQEFRLETSTTNANNGMHSGASVNVVTKAGTNLLHGDLFEFVRNHRFNATNPFNAIDPVTGKRQGDGLSRNQYRRHARRSGCDRPRLLLRRVPGHATARDPCGPVRLRADGRDARRRLHAVRLGPVQHDRCREPASALRQQPPQPGARSAPRR